MKPPIFLQTIMGVMGGIGAEVDHLAHMKATADRLLGDAVQWSVLGAGRHQFNMITVSAVMGSHVRVGLEDGLFIGKGQLAESNAEQVEKISADPRRALARHRHTRRHARDPRPQGHRPGRLVSAGRAPVSIGRPHCRHHRHRCHRRRLGGALPADGLRRRRAGIRVPGAEERLAALVDTAWPALERLGLRDGAPARPAAVRRHLAEALAGADFVQESAPEVLDAKIALLAEIDAATPAWRRGRRRARPDS